MATGQEVGEKSRGTRLGTLKQEVLRKASFFEHKAVIDYRDLYHLIRHFFKEYLERDYEFTISELREEVKRTYIPISIRDDVFSLLDTIEKMEYETVKYPRIELVNILVKFRKVVEELVKTHKRRHGFWSKVRGFLLKEEEEPILLSELPVIETSDEPHIHINLLLEKIYIFFAQKKIAKAKKQYAELIEYYNQVPEDLKREYFPIIDETYNKLIELSTK